MKKHFEKQPLPHSQTPSNFFIMFWYTNLSHIVNPFEKSTYKLIFGWQLSISSMLIFYSSSLQKKLIFNCAICVTFSCLRKLSINFLFLLSLTSLKTSSIISF